MNSFDEKIDETKSVGATPFKERTLTAKGESFSKKCQRLKKHFLVFQVEIVNRKRSSLKDIYLLVFKFNIKIYCLKVF